MRRQGVWRPSRHYGSGHVRGPLQPYQIRHKQRKHPVKWFPSISIPLLLRESDFSLANPKKRKKLFFKALTIVSSSTFRRSKKINKIFSSSEFLFLVRWTKEPKKSIIIGRRARPRWIADYATRWIEFRFCRRSAMTIFSQRKPGQGDYRVWNAQLISYAGEIHHEWKLASTK